MEEIAARLGALAAEFAGPIFDQQAPEGLESADLRRFEFEDGPRVFEVSIVGDVNVELRRIDAKIAHYKDGWGMRAELLAYARWGLPFSDRENNAVEYLNARLPAGIFSRGWIYELTSRLIVARSP